MDFRKQGMEADAFKEEGYMSQQTASDLASMVPSSNITIEKVMPSLSLGWVDNTMDRTGETDEWEKESNKHKLGNSEGQASVGGKSQHIDQKKTVADTPGKQDQVMRQQMEQLQRLVAEQQKIIALYNPDNSQLKERSFPETFSAVKEEQREQVKEEIPPSLFGIEGKMKTGNIEDRPITPAIGIRQKTSEEFVEEQLQVDNHLTEKQQKDQQSKAKVTPQKAFLKRKEGMARLKKNKQKPLKEDSKHPRRAGLDSWGHFSQTGQGDAGILQPGECSQSNLQVSSSMQIGTHEKKADCALAEWEIKAQTDCEAKVVEQSAEEKEVIGRDEDAKENPVDSPQRRWPEILQPCPETVTEMNLQVGEERETHHRDSLGQAGRTDGRPVEGTLQKDLGRVDQPLKGHLTERAKSTLEVLQKHSPLQDLETDRIKEAEWSAGPAFTQGQRWVQVCPQELVSGSQSSESKRQIHTEFKMINDKIVKITCSSPEAVEKGSSSSALQQERQRKGTTASTWHIASLSCESSCLSSNSDDDPKSHYAQYPSQHGPQGVDHTDRHLDLSDGDYASDESRGTEKMSVKKYSRSPPRKQGIQVISRQQDLSCSTSSSDSTTGAVRLKGSKACSSLHQSLFHLARSKRREHELESKNENRARDVKSLDLPSSTVAGEIPAFKIKETPAMEEPQKKLYTDTLDVFIEETQNILTRGLETGVYHGGTPLLTRVKEEQEKAMQFLRTRMDQLKTVRSQELTHPLEYNKDQIYPLQKEKIAHSKFKGTARVTGENVKSEEIKILKQQIAGLQEEFKRNESCWHAAYGKLRDQVEMLTRQNMELRDELRVSEHQRWKAEKPPEAVNFMDRKSETLVEEVLTDGRRIITFRNGTKKEISADKRMTTISFFNGDVKKIMPDQRVMYYYADAQTTHTAYPDGLEVLQFPNNQIEKHYPDGTQEIVFPDHTVKCLYSDGFKETFFPDGTVVKVEKNGDKIVVFSNGQKEVHTAQFKRREYPDGTVKTVYRNGRQETKYSTGRVRIKDEEGNIILDKK
ncbi:PREDICTED: centromere protein J-like [Pygoscelis adeliae]|uniref:centromere protein J-like n=1 Tax=Pygoscelis adeliae TaxID=9238 RepID=UPI0004F4EB93|nr:PREDICTED: centromere protein J-like [Pygoscelis adeliae]